jgi:hypothetical protein
VNPLARRENDLLACEFDLLRDCLSRQRARPPFAVLA